MNKRKILLLPFLVIIISGCNSEPDPSQIVNSMLKEMNTGNLSRVRHLADSVIRTFPDNKALVYIADSLGQVAERIEIDFSLTEDQVKEQIEKRIGSFTESDKMEWEEKGWLEYRLTEGKKMYFRRAVSNLFLLKKFYEDHGKWIKSNTEDPEMITRLKHTTRVVDSGSHGNPAEPVDAEITYTITVHPDAVPDGETIRCWMPWPKSNNLRQGNVELLTT
jgi:hypothetical protein